MHLAGDEIVTAPDLAYTLAISIAASPSQVWPWLLQMGQGRAGFYTHEWAFNLFGAGIRNVDRVVPELQDTEVGDVVRLTPDPYFGKPGQYLVVARLDPEEAFVLKQRLPGGGLSSWAFVLRPLPDGSTRLLFRRRGTRPSIFDRVALPGHLYMDRGMLSGIARRVTRARRPSVDGSPAHAASGS